MNPDLKRRALLLSGLAAFPGLAMASDLFARRKLRTRCYIPQYDYQPHRFTDPVSEGTFSAIAYLVDGSGRSSTTTGNMERLKTFQMRKANLTLDHCQISHVTITISSTGNWTMHMQAKQHPGELLAAKLRPPFERFQRNLFRVDVRPVGLMTLDTAEATSPIAKPEFPCIPMQQFWIQKDQTQRIQRRGHSRDLARYFDVIQQTEIHFSYR